MDYCEIDVSNNSKDYFLKKVAEYYPRKISPLYDSTNYRNQPEYERLMEEISKRDIFPESQKDQLIADLKRLYGLDFKDVSLFSWQDRAYNLQTLLKKEALICEVLCINISVLIPYFTIYVLKTEQENSNDLKRKYSPLVSQELFNKYPQQVDSIQSLLRHDYDLNDFPHDLKNEIVNDVGFQDIPIGKFTFFNAFFLDKDNYTQFF